MNSGLHCQTLRPFPTAAPVQQLSENALYQAEEQVGAAVSASSSEIKMDAPLPKPNSANNPAVFYQAAAPISRVVESSVAEVLKKSGDFTNSSGVHL